MIFASTENLWYDRVIVTAVKFWNNPALKSFKCENFFLICKENQMIRIKSNSILVDQSINQNGKENFLVLYPYLVDTLVNWQKIRLNFFICIILLDTACSNQLTKNDWVNPLPTYFVKKGEFV